jgi:DnaK suppressor protein
MGEPLDSYAREGLRARRRQLETACCGDPGRTERLIDEVDAALERIEAGTYGLCRECHEPIETDRLLADPWPSSVWIT